MNAPNERLGNSLLMENEHLRVWDHRVAAGKTGDIHLHRRPYLSVVIGGGKGQTVNPSGNVLQEFQLEPGKVYWYGSEDLPEVHALRNTGSADIAVITIELLSPSL